MSSKQPTVLTAQPRQREFATSAVAVQAIVINPSEEVLLLSSPTRRQGWQLVSGALEAGETLLDGTLRELHEELGKKIRVRPLGTVHVESFHYDAQVQFMLSINSLFAYLGGDVIPGDDMQGSEFRWWSLSALTDNSLLCHATVKPWMLKRAVDLYRLWQNQPDVPLQPVI